MSWRHWITLSALISTATFAQEDEASTNEQNNDIELVKQCILNEVIGGDGKQTLDDLRKKCSSLEEDKQLTALDKRQAREQVGKKNRNVITPHKRNYILPLSYVSHPNDRPFDGFDELTDDNDGEPLDNLEAKYQLSIKVHLYDDFSEKLIPASHPVPTLFSPSFFRYGQETLACFSSQYHRCPRTQVGLEETESRGSNCGKLVLYYTWLSVC